MDTDIIENLFVQHIIAIKRSPSLMSGFRVSAVKTTSVGRKSRIWQLKFPIVDRVLSQNFIQIVLSLGAIN